MKSLIVLPFVALMLLASQVSALCLYITDSYSGTVEADTEQTAYGPFTITSSNGCSAASIDVSITASGVGRAPEVFIERQIGGTWKRETFGLGTTASHSGPLGIYRVRVGNDGVLPIAYSGTTKYGR